MSRVSPGTGISVATALAARAVDAISAAQPKAVALDILYTDPTTEADDGALARSIYQAGNVVVAAQLVPPLANGGTTGWLLPLPAIEHAAAAVGHVEYRLNRTELRARF